MALHYLKDLTLQTLSVVNEIVKPADNYSAHVRESWPDQRGYKIAERLVKIAKTDFPCNLLEGIKRFAIDEIDEIEDELEQAEKDLAECANV